MRMSEADFNKIIKEGHVKISKDNLRFSTSDVESYLSNEATGPDEIKAFDKRVIISIHSKRYRLADSDGLCAKWVIDTIVKAGILVDDRPEFVKEVRFSQEKIKKPKKEQTIISIEQIEENN